MRISLLITMAVALYACDNSNPERSRDIGYSDGYAVGFNTTCEIRKTLIDGDFDNPDYANAY